MTNFTALSQTSLSAEVIELLNKQGVIDVQSAIALLSRLKLDNSQTILNDDQLRQAWTCLASYQSGDNKDFAATHSLPPMTCYGGIPNAAKRSVSDNAKVALYDLLEQLQNNKNNPDNANKGQLGQVNNKDDNNE